MATQFPNLFSPIKIGNKTARNRILFPCHGTAISFGFMADYGEPSGYIAYETARAKGGCGLVVIGTTRFHPSSIRLSIPPPPTPEKLIPKLQKMADAVHEHGTLVLLQLYHRGNGMASEGQTMPSWGFSELPSLTDHAEVCHEMDDDEINLIIDLFAKYALTAKQGGMDGIEIHACHGCLVQQSWSPWANRRTDKWGKQFTFITEILNRIRSAVGNDFVVAVRMTSDDFLPSGMDNEANKKVAQALEATGKVDLLNLSLAHGGGSYAWTVPSMFIPPASLCTPLASGIKGAVKAIPVAACGGINDPALAESIIADGHADMVAIVRGLICDPEFGNKAREGRVDDIRLCARCSQTCVSEEAGLPGPTCTQNAVAGRELSKYAKIEPAPKKKKVLVIGGGPAGMETARVAAIRGHDVTLYEKENQLGGQINTLSKAPGREEFNQVTRYLETQLNKLGVKVKLGVEATPETVKQEKPDTVVLATGSRPFIEPIPGSDQANVVNPSQVLNGEVTVGKRVIVYDTTGLQEAPTVADFLADQGKQVEIITKLPTIAVNWGGDYWRTTLSSPMPVIGPRLRKKGIVFTGCTVLKKISGRTVTVADVWNEEERTIENVDTVVMATGYRANSNLYPAIKGQVKDIYRVGDCFAPRRVSYAIRMGYEAAFNI